MRGTVARRLRKAEGGQERLAQRQYVLSDQKPNQKKWLKRFKDYILNEGEKLEDIFKGAISTTVRLSPELNRVGYKMAKEEYKRRF